jgi:hypothetical protein
MFEQFFDGVSRVQALRDGPGGPFLERFAEELFHAGYAEITTDFRASLTVKSYKIL